MSERVLKLLILSVGCKVQLEHFYINYLQGQFVILNTIDLVTKMESIDQIFR